MSFPFLKMFFFFFFFFFCVFFLFVCFFLLFKVCSFVVVATWSVLRGRDGGSVFFFSQREG